MKTWHDEIDDLIDKDTFLEQAQIYVEMLNTYTKVHNITALKTKYEMYSYIVDSIYPIRYFEKMPQNLADVGSGAGFPALLLALALPACEISLYEPISKKSAFLHWCKVELRLYNVNVVSKRIEQSNKMYDFITSRAVSDINTLLGFCKNVSNEFTTFLLYKGSSVKDEMNENFNAKIYEKNQRRYVFLQRKI